MGLIINNAIRVSNASYKKAQDEFWKKEQDSYKTPSRPASSLEFITFPDDLPLHISTDNPQIKEYQETLVNITKNRVINLSGISNTDIRTMYGKHYMEELSKADGRFTVMCRTLNRLSEAYMELGYEKEAYRLLEFASSVGSDVREGWLTLGQHYLDTDDMDALSSLIDKAEKLRDCSPLKKDIVKWLKELQELRSIVK